MRVVHHIDRWLPLSAGFVHAAVSRSAHRPIVVSRDAIENRDVFPQRPLVSLAPLHRVGTGAGARRLRDLSLTAIVLAGRADLLHVHFGYAVHDALATARRTRVPLVLSLHGDDATALPRQRPGFYAGVTDRVDAVVVPSRWLAARAAELGFATEQVHVVPSGVDPAVFVPTPMPDGAPVAVFVGRLVEKKGLDTLLAAWPLVREAVPDAQLRVLGEGPEAARLEPARLPSGVVHLRPQRHRRHQQVRELIQGSTVVVSPSQTSGDGDAESLLLVNLEAQASGRPVVTTRHGGIPEFVEEDRTALLVPERSPALLADALIRVLSDPALARRLGAAGPAQAARFDVRAGAARLDALYEGLSRRSR